MLYLFLNSSFKSLISWFIFNTNSSISEKNKSSSPNFFFIVSSVLASSVSFAEGSGDKKTSFF
jgi:hypothetical protein